MLKKAVWPSGQRVWLTIWWSLSPGATPLYMPCGPKGDGFCAVLVWKRVQKMNLWSEIGSGFKEPCGTTLSRIPGVPPPPPQDGCEDILWTWMTLFTLSMIWKTQEEEDWIFKNTQKLADRKSNRQSLSPDWQLCFLLSCFYKQTSAFMSIPPTLSAGDFSHVLSGWVRSFNYSIATCNKKPLVSRVHPQAFVTTGSSIFSLTTSSGIFRGRGYAFAG